MSEPSSQPTWQPGGEVRVTVKGISDEAVTTPAGIVKTQKYELLVHGTRLDVHDDACPSMAGLGSPGSICRPTA